MSYPSIKRYKSKEQKTFSQKMARLFEVVNYILLIPTSFVVFCVLYFSICYYVHNFHSYIFVPFKTWLIFFLTPYGLFCLLLRGYFLHSRGRLDKSKLNWLWIGTIAYNIISFSYYRLWILKVSDLNIIIMKVSVNRVVVFLLCWSLVAFVISVVCIFNSNKIQKYR